MYTAARLAASKLRKLRTVIKDTPYVHYTHTASTISALEPAGKRIAETLTMDYNREYGVEVRIVRIYNTYGPRKALDDGRVVSNFVK